MTYKNFITFLILLLLVNNNIILLNEEALILICFCSFCWIAISKLTKTVNQFFINQIDNLKFDLINSWNHFTVQAQNLIRSLLKYNLWSKNFIKLEEHFLVVSKFTLNNLQKLYKNNLKLKINKKLDFTKQLEKQILKLVSLIIIEKLDKFILLNKFFSTEIELKSILSIQKIGLFEYFKKIKI